MLVIFVIVFSLAICSIIWLLFPLGSVKECWETIKYMNKKKKAIKKLNKYKLSSNEIKEARYIES